MDRGGRTKEKRVYFSKGLKQQGIDSLEIPAIWIVYSKARAALMVVGLINERVAPVPELEEIDPNLEKYFSKPVKRKDWEEPLEFFGSSHWELGGCWKGFPGGSGLNRLPPMRETGIRSLGWEYPLEKEMATHSSIVAWRIPWTEEPGRLQSMGSQRVGHDWATSLHFTSLHLKRLIKRLKVPEHLNL